MTANDKRRIAYALWVLAHYKDEIKEVVGNNPENDYTAYEVVGIIDDLKRKFEEDLK